MAAAAFGFGFAADLRRAITATSQTENAGVLGRAAPLLKHHFPTPAEAFDVREQITSAYLAGRPPAEREAARSLNAPPPWTFQSDLDHANAQAEHKRRRRNAHHNSGAFFTRLMEATYGDPGWTLGGYVATRVASQSARAASAARGRQRAVAAERQRAWAETQRAVAEEQRLAERAAQKKIYAVELEQDHVYVGSTRRPEQVRMDEHRRGLGEGAEWTRLFPPTERRTFLEVLLCPEGWASGTMEDAMTKHYMQLRGIDMVRGGAYCTLAGPDADTRVMLEREFAHARGECYWCHSPGHFAEACPQRAAAAGGSSSSSSSSSSS